MYQLQLGIKTKGQKWEDIAFHTHHTCETVEEITEVFCQVTHQEERVAEDFRIIFSKEEHTQGGSIFFANGRELPDDGMRESGIRARVLKVQQ